MKGFDWEEYRTNKVWVHVKNEEEAKDFFAQEAKHNRYGNRYERSWVENEDRYICCHGGYTEERRLKRRFREGEAIVEWSDYMKKEFTKDDLKTGHVVTLESGCQYVVVRDGDFTRCKDNKELTDVLISADNKILAYLCDFDQGLKSKIAQVGDVVKVERLANPFLLRISEPSRLIKETLWERHQPKKMTVQEIEAALGHPVKIVKERAND